jgi:hypothetical protein
VDVKQLRDSRLRLSCQREPANEVEFYMRPAQASIDDFSQIKTCQRQTDSRVGEVNASAVVQQTSHQSPVQRPNIKTGSHLTRIIFQAISRN